MLGGKENSSASGQNTQQQPQQGYAQQPYSSATQNDNYDAPYAADEYAF